jgi:ubiquinone biosynthesis O-methyltransferase
VIASEVIEHVASVPDFCTSLVRASSPGGMIILSTLNRTPSSYMAAIVGAEYVFKWVPQGTHEWEKFITPEELVHHMEAAGKSVGNTSCSVDMTAGMTYQPIIGIWYLSKDLSINYISSFLTPKI